jgi:hypothetical protein
MHAQVSRFADRASSAAAPIRDPESSSSPRSLSSLRDDPPTPPLPRNDNDLGRSAGMIGAAPPVERGRGGGGRRDGGGRDATPGVSAVLGGSRRAVIKTRRARVPPPLTGPIPPTPTPRVVIAEPFIAVYRAYCICVCVCVRARARVCVCVCVRRVCKRKHREDESEFEVPSKQCSQQAESSG